jgi:hypothetical protein
MKLNSINATMIARIEMLAARQPVSEILFSSFSW